MKLPNDTLYLPIKQVYFDQIIAGTKKEELREIKMGITANKYLQRVMDDNDNPVKDTNDTEGYVRDLEHTDPKLYLAVGYAKERDTALVEIDGYRFIPEMIRADKYAFWVIAYHIGKVLEVHRK